MADDFNPNEWVQINCKNGVFECTVPDSPGSRFVETLDVEEDLLWALNRITCYAKSTKGIVFRWIPGVPFSLFATMREHFFVNGVNMVGYDFGLASAYQHTLVHLETSAVHMLQLRYVDGPLNGERIPKYGWFDDKHFHSEFTGTDYALYSRRTVDSRADVFFLGNMPATPEGYMNCGPLRLQDQPDGFLDKAWKEIGKRVAPNRVGLIKIQNYEQSITFAFQPSLVASFDELKLWVNQGFHLNDEDRNGLRRWSFG